MKPLPQDRCPTRGCLKNVQHPLRTFSKYLVQARGGAGGRANGFTRKQLWRRSDVQGQGLLGREGMEG